MNYFETDIARHIGLRLMVVLAAALALNNPAEADDAPFYFIENWKPAGVYLKRQNTRIDKLAGGTVWIDDAFCIDAGKAEVTLWDPEAQTTRRVTLPTPNGQRCMPVRAIAAEPVPGEKSTYLRQVWTFLFKPDAPEKLISARSRGPKPFTRLCDPNWASEVQYITAGAQALSVPTRGKVTLADADGKVLQQTTARNGRAVLSSRRFLSQKSPHWLKLEHADQQCQVRLEVAPAPDDAAREHAASLRLPRPLADVLQTRNALENTDGMGWRLHALQGLAPHLKTYAPAAIMWAEVLAPPEPSPQSKQSDR